MAFPTVVVDTIATNNGMGNDVTVNLPTGIVVGELLEIALAADGTARPRLALLGGQQIWAIDHSPT